VRYYGDQSAQVNAVRLRNRVAFRIAGPRFEPARLESWVALMHRAFAIDVLA